MEFPSRNWAALKMGILAVSLGWISAGCTSTSAAKTEPVKLISGPSQEQAATIQALNEEIARLNQELDQVFSSRDDLARAKSDLEGQLQGEMAAGDASVSMQTRDLL